MGPVRAGIGLSASNRPISGEGGAESGRKKSRRIGADVYDHLIRRLPVETPYPLIGGCISEPDSVIARVFSDENVEQRGFFHRQLCVCSTNEHLIQNDFECRAQTRAVSINNWCFLHDAAGASLL